MSKLWNIKEFIKLLQEAKPETLMMSRKHCHAINLSSVVLKVDSSGSLTRIFLAWPFHYLQHNIWPAPNLTVGVHNHRYDITLTPCIGAVFNERYTYSATGDDYDEYVFVSGVKSGTFVANNIGSRRLEMIQSTLLTEPLSMKADELHTVGCNHMAAWIVQEGPEKQKTTRLFSNKKVEVDTRFYEPFINALEVKQHCLDFLQLANREVV